MTDSQKQKIDALIDVLPENEREIYREIAEYATQLGYSPSKVKEKYEPVIFAKTIKGYGYRRLCRISPPNPASSDEPKTSFALSFYAMSDYSEIFHESVRKECESRKERIIAPVYSEVFYRKNDNCRFRKDTCNECRKCKPYYYTYPCGKIIECDHVYLIGLPPIGTEHIDEIKALLKAQHECWTHHL